LTLTWAQSENSPNRVGLTSPSTSLPRFYDLGMTRMKTISAAAVALLTLAACSSGSETADNEFFHVNDLDGMSTTQVIDHLDQLPLDQRPEDYMASVQADEVVFSDGSSEYALDIPDDEFYISIAPYASQTHECYYHSLTTCQGELNKEKIQEKVTKDSGHVVLNEERVSYENGFIGLWLPRGISRHLPTEDDDGQVGRNPFSTDDD